MLRSINTLRSISSDITVADTVVHKSQLERVSPNSHKGLINITFFEHSILNRILYVSSIVRSTIEVASSNNPLTYLVVCATIEVLLDVVGERRIPNSTTI